MVGPISATISAIYIVHIYMENGKVVDYKKSFFFYLIQAKNLKSAQTINLYIHTYIYIYSHISIYTHILISISLYICIHTSNIHSYTYIYTYACKHRQIPTYVHI